MKKIIVLVVALTVSAVAMAGIYGLYNFLGEKFEPELPELPTLPNQSQTSDNGESEPQDSEPQNSEGENNIPESENGGADIPDSSEPESSGSESDSETKIEVSEFLAPDFTVYDENGNAVDLHDYLGKPIVLNFWATWCYYCKIEMPDFNEVAKKYPDVQFLMVNATGTRGETVESAKKYISDNGFEFNVLYDIDRDALNTYGVTGFPTTFFIASNGDLYTYYSGSLDAGKLENIIAKVKEYSAN